LACRLYHLSPEEALLASTINGAKALRLEHDRGSLEPGKLADIQIWNIPTFEHVIYRLGNNAVETVVKRGIIQVGREPQEPVR
jgi:imidazolonepropionase